MESQDLQLLLQGSASLLVIETFDEPRALDLLVHFLKRDPAPLYRWSITEGLQLAGLSLASTPTSEEKSVELEVALKAIKVQRIQGIYVLCDTHPFIDEPKIIRLIKDILFSKVPAHKIILLSHALNLPVELARFAVKIPVNLPSDEEILGMIREEAEHWSRFNGGHRIKTDNQALLALVSNLRGLPHLDVRRLARGAIADDGAITASDLPFVNKAKFQLMNMDSVLHFEFDTASMSDVAGLMVFKRWLNERRPAFLEGSKDIPKGVLLLGVQGGGKSLAAKAVAGVWSIPLLRLDMAQLFNKYIGETEKNLRQALALADTLSPCVLWIDELEKGLATNSSEGGLTQRILGTLLTWMSERKSRVFIVATSNEISDLPPELLRKGRFDEIFFIDLPDKNIRQQIFSIHLQKREMDIANFNLSALADATEGFTGAEIEQAVVSAIYNATARKRTIDTECILTAVHKTKPLSVVMAEPMAKLRAWAATRAVSAG
ncbi:MAG: AAA family ATPase [Marinagarivorans sp.]|nr:AAA family ATPase [Marinagarivorans sp.]